jgi:phosphoglycerate-specific signal transduction histidine kinase
MQLQQVLLNLIINAIQSMSGVHDCPRDLIIRCTSDTPNEGVLITVEDSGTGFDPSSGERIFDSMFTTKEGGMGMGLSISRSIIAARPWRPDLGIARRIRRRDLPYRPAVEARRRSRSDSCLATRPRLVHPAIYQVTSL